MWKKSRLNRKKVHKEKKRKVKKKKRKLHSLRSFRRRAGVSSGKSGKTNCWQMKIGVLRLPGNPGKESGSTLLPMDEETRLHFVKTAAMTALLKRYFEKLIAVDVRKPPL